VVDAIQAQKTVDHGFAYFYVDFPQDKTRQLKYVLRSLLAQLLVNQPGLIQSRFQDLVRRMVDNSEPPSDALELADLLVRASSHYSDVTLVLDALDECVPRDEFLPCFERLGTSGDIRIFVTSRRERDLRDLFKDKPNISLEVEGKHVLADMEKHIRTELENDYRYLWKARVIRYK